MINNQIVNLVYYKIINSKSLEELKFIKIQLEEDIKLNNNYDYKDLLILSLAIDFKTYVLINESDDKSIKYIYNNFILKITKNSLKRIKKLITKNKF
jgi:hypothetical protein